MLYPNIDTIDEHPSIPGASLIRFRDGSSIAAPTPIASRFAPGVMGSGAVAQNMSVPGPNASIVGPVAPPPMVPAQPGGMSLPGPSASSVPDQRPPAPTMSVSDVPQGIPAAPSFTVAPPTQPVPQGPAIDRTTGLDAEALRRVYQPIHMAGRAAYDPTADDASRRAVRTSQMVQHAGAREWDPERQTDLLINQREAIQADAEAKSLAAQTNAQAQRMAAQDQERRYQEQQAQQRIQEQAWKGEQSRLQKEANEVASAEVKPNRVFSGAPVFQTIGLAIAAGLKGYATSGRDNSVLDTVQRMIDRDVAVQESEIARKKGEADNALARNIQQFGSIEAGRAATRAQGLQASLARFDANVAAIGLPAKSAQIEAERQKFEAAAYDAFEQTRVASMGTTSTATQAAMVAPRAAVAGGTFAPDERTVQRRLAEEQAIALRGADIGGKRLTNEGKDVENLLLRARGLTPEGAQKADENLKTRVEHLGHAQAELSGMRNHVDQLASLAGITEDKEGNAHHKGIPGVGVGYNVAAANPILSYLLGGQDTAKSVMADLVSAKGGRIRRSMLELLTAKIKDASGAAFSEKEAERHASALAQGLAQGEDAFAQAVVDFRRTLTQKELEIKAAAGVEAVQKYKADRASLSQDENARKDGVLGAF